MNRVLSCLLERCWYIWSGAKVQVSGQQFFFKWQAKMTPLVSEVGQSLGKTWSLQLPVHLSAGLVAVQGVPGSAGQIQWLRGLQVVSLYCK